MAAHKIRAVAITENGTEVVVYPETIANQVLCTVPTDLGATVNLPLDELLNQYADEINANGEAINNVVDGGVTSVTIGGVKKASLAFDSDPQTQITDNSKNVYKATDLTALNALPVAQKKVNRIYIALNDNKEYHWSGSAFVLLSPSLPIATQAQAEAGLDNTAVLTPLRLSQYMQKNFSTADLPAQNGTLTYNGSAQSPLWLNYDTAKLTIGKTFSATNAGAYVASFTPKPGFTWNDGTTTAKDVLWNIGRASITVAPTQSGSLTYNAASQSPTWANHNATQLTIGGEINGTNAGSYNATFTPTANYQWSDITTTAKTVSWSIAKAAGSLSLNPTSLTLNESNLSKTIAVTRAGDGTITALSNNTSIATVSVSETTVTVNNVNSTTGTATITVSVASGTNHTAPASTTCAVTAQFLPIKQALNSMTWADINTICQAGKAAEYWAIGDTKTVTLSTSDVITVRIEDFNHDNLTAGGKAKVTFGMVDCLNAVRAMNSTNTNVGGWGSSAMKSFMSTLLSQMPSELQAAIKQVTKTTSAGNVSSSLTTTNDFVWIFSATEVGQSIYNVAGEGTLYPLFISDASRVKKVNNSASNWWLRSPFAGGPTAFYYVHSNGAGTGGASYTNGVAAGFCI